MPIGILLLQNCLFIFFSLNLILVNILSQFSSGYPKRYSATSISQDLGRVPYWKLTQYMDTQNLVHSLETCTVCLYFNLCMFFYVINMLPGPPIKILPIVFFRHKKSLPIGLKILVTPLLISSEEFIVLDVFYLFIVHIKKRKHNTLQDYNKVQCSLIYIMKE